MTDVAEVSYCPVCDTWTGRFHLHEMQREGPAP